MLRELCSWQKCLSVVTYLDMLIKMVLLSDTTENQ